MLQPRIGSAAVAVLFEPQNCVSVYHLSTRGIKTTEDVAEVMNAFLT